MAHGPPTPQPAGRPYSSLAVSLTADILAGLGTSLVVSPLVTIIDTSLTLNASGKDSLIHALGTGIVSIVRKPGHFLSRPSFLAVYAVFSGTYVTNNVVDTVCTHNHVNPVQPKFFIGSAANVSLNLYKDMLFTKWFAPVAPKPLPRASYALFALRDTMTITTAFVMPPFASPLLQQEPLRLSKPRADFLAQLTLPCLVQLVSAPIHLTSLDLYNNPQHTVRQRLELIGRNYIPCSFGRVLRTIPGFGVGGVLNRWGRLELTVKLREFSTSVGQIVETQPDQFTIS
ncbi:hypothetical protein BC830DRAFT_1131361 [Chytriomyces sp. MP71]|nr:hypothetical protein BC830DRAFT_1131361 [Chytriomyces sp. MP71]